MKFNNTYTVERGILTSAYKREIKQNISASKRATISNFKTIIEDHQNRIQSQTGTILRVAVFFAAIIMIVY